MNLLVVIGTRPEAIKMAPVIKRFLLEPGFSLQVCSTGQHREMLASVLSLFAIEPDFNLDLMEKHQTLSSLSAKMYSRFDQVLEQSKPDMVLVQGDTTTAMVAATCAFYRKIPVAHVEAGLRSFDLGKPWPEEFNRKVIGQFARLHFVPTEKAKQNLLNDGVAAQDIFLTGNTVVDALLQAKHKIDVDPELSARLDQKYSFLDQDKRLILMTGHRRENWGEGQEAVFAGIHQLVDGDTSIQVLYPVHMNPVVKQKANSLLADSNNIFLVPPVDYIEMVYLLMRSYFIITDSGGLQEEAPTFGKPLLVTRDVTERTEGVEAGTAILVGCDRDKIVCLSQRLLEDEGFYAQMSCAQNPYGDGTAADSIFQALMSYRQTLKNKDTVLC